MWKEIAILLSNRWKSSNLRKQCLNKTLTTCEVIRVYGDILSIATVVILTQIPLLSLDGDHFLHSFQHILRLDLV